MLSDSEKTTLQRLMELKDLYESGLITKEEMEAKKLQILGTDEASINVQNRKIENELNNESLNQSKDGDKLNSFRSPTEEKEEHSEPSNNKQGDEQHDGTIIRSHNYGRKILKISLIAAAVVVVIVVLAIVLTPTNYNKKVEKAIEKYKSQNVTILSASSLNEATKDNHYVIFQKSDTIYIDELERKTPVKAILPRKDGFFIKRLSLKFENEKPILSYEMLNEGNRSNLQIRPMLKVQFAYEGKRAICMKEMEDGFASRSYFYTMYNPDTIFAVNGEFVEAFGSVVAEHHFSFADVVDEFISDWQEYSFRDYRFELPVYYEINDMRPCRFHQYCRFNKDEYPMDLLTKEFRDQNFDYGFPSDWFGTSDMDRFIECLRQDIDRKENEAIMNQILSQAVDFDEMCREFNSNPVNANQRYQIGEPLLLSVRVDKIGHSKLEGFKYVVYTENHDENCYIYTNNEEFVDINYPNNIVIGAKFDRRYIGEDNLTVAIIEALIGVIDTRTSYIFTDAELIICDSYEDGSGNYYNPFRSLSH